jgi:hypothetical protein
MQYSPFKVDRRFGGTCCLHLQSQGISQTGKQSESWWHAWLYLPLAFTLVSCLAYSSNHKMEAACSSETSVDFQRISRRYIPENILVLLRRFLYVPTAV